MAILILVLMNYLSIRGAKMINKLEVINKCRTIRLNIMQMQYDYDAGVINDKEYKRMYKTLEREIKKLEKKFL